MKWLSVFLVFGCALTLSSLAGMVSIMGMMALFSSDGWMIGVMMAALEASKIVAAGWIHANWKNPAVSFLHKSYFLLAVIALMLITGIGIYGYLSKGYLDQQIPMGAQSLQIDQRERQIETDKQNIQRLTERQNQLDAAVNSMIAQKYVNRSQVIRTQQKKERDQIAIDLDQNQKNIDKLSAELIPLKMATQNVEAKLGPIKYLAELFGWTQPDMAVRIVILILMFAFDPLAIMLVLSGSITVREKISVKRPERVFISTRKCQPLPNKTVEPSPLDDISDKQEILNILQRNPDSIEDVIDTVLEWHEQYLKKE